jgi:hypothetical protein
MAMVDEKWGRNQQVAAYDSFAILRPISGVPSRPRTAFQTTRDHRTVGSARVAAAVKV